MSIDTYTQLDRHFQGYARINLDNVEFESGRDLDDKNVKRLVGIFRLQGCERETTANAISVLVKRDALRNVPPEQKFSTLTNHFITLDRLPHLDIEVLCLQGKHRIHAARKILHSSDRWWPAKVFDNDLPLYAQEYIRHETSKALDLSNGDIFRHYLDAERRHDESANDWLSMLGSTMQSRVKQLKENDDFLKSYLELLPFAGLWPDCDLGPLNRELPMRCREEQYCYLHSIHRTWTHILGPDIDPHCLDLQTVRSLEVLMPANSTCDARTISASIRNFEIFVRVRDPSIRQELQDRLLGCDRIITLRTFHRDTIVLEGCYQPLRHLFLNEETTLWSACEASFKHDPRYLQANYIDLWLHVMRNHPYLSNHLSAKPIKDRSDKDAPAYLKSEAEVSKLVSFAASRGFTFQSLLRRDNDEMQSEPVWTTVAKLSCEKGNIERSHRSSRPHVDDFEEAWKHLSLQSVFQTPKQTTLKYPTAFAVIRDIVRCFWGSVPPCEMNNPDRLLQLHQCNDLHNSASVVGNGLQMPPRQDDTDEDFNAMQIESHDTVNLPPPTSSRYSDSSQATTTPTFRPCESIAGGVEWDEGGFIESYMRCVDTPDFDDGFDMQATENCIDRDPDHGAQMNADVAIAFSPNSRSSSLDPTNTEPLYLLPQVQATHTEEDSAKAHGLWQASSGPKQRRGRGEQTDGWLHKLKNVGTRKPPHRVEKSRYETQNSKVKQQKTRMARAMQSTIDELRGTDGRRPTSTMSPKGMQLETPLPLESNGFNPSQHARQNSGDFTEHIHTPSFDVEPQWINTDREEDVWTGMKRAEEQMRSADDAVGEVYDDSLHDHSVQNSEAENGVMDAAASGPNAALTRPKSLFPGNTLVPHGKNPLPTKDSSTSLEAVSSSGKRQYPNMAVADNRLNANGQAVIDDNEFISVGNGPSQGRTNAPVPVDERYTEAADPGLSPLVSQRITPFPGQSDIPGPRDALYVVSNSGNEVGQDGTKARSTGVSKRKLGTDEVAEHVQIRSAHNGFPAQLKDWEPSKDAVLSVENLQHELDQNRIYITSLVDIAEFVPRQHRNHARLWSWSRAEKLEFDAQVGALLQVNFRLQMVSSSQHAIPRNYTTVTPMTYWSFHFEVDRSLYWLAVLSPESGTARSREKVMRT